MVAQNPKFSKKKYTKRLKCLKRNMRQNQTIITAHIKSYNNNLTNKTIIKDSSQNLALTIVQKQSIKEMILTR